MNSRCRYELIVYLKEIKSRYKNEIAKLEQLKEFSARKLRLTHDRDGKEYYYILDPEKKKYRYLGNSLNKDVQKIKEAHYLQLSVRELQREIRLIENVLSWSRCVDYEDINRKLSHAYKWSNVSFSTNVSTAAREWKLSMEEYKKTIPVYKPEELIHKTRDGTYVRSKGEALIYNYLLDIGATFVYELPLKIRLGHKVFHIWPDFTILSEIDYETVIYIEHQGKMNDAGYREQFKERVYRYWINNYLPERDVFFTFDLPNGGFDDAPISSIIQRFIRP